MQAQQQGRHAEAAEAYAVALGAGVPPAHETGVRSNYGLMLEKSGRPNEAVAVHDTVVSLSPDYADGHHNRGNALYAATRWEEAMGAFSTAVQLVPTDAESYFNRGNAASKAARHAEAAHSFAAAFELEPRDAAAAFNLANAQRALGLREEAARSYRATIQLQGSYAAAYSNLGLCLSDEGRHAEAADALRGALSVDCNDAGAYTSLGHALRLAEDVDGAIGAYQEALRLEPKQATAYAGLASALKRVDRAASRAAYYSAVAADPALEAQANATRAWLDAREASAPAEVEEFAEMLHAGSRYPAPIEAAAGQCASMTMAEATAMGQEALVKGGPVRIRNASDHWAARSWDDATLAREVGGVPMQMLAMPGPEHPTLDGTHGGAILEPAQYGVAFKDYLRLLDALAPTSRADAPPFAAYLAMLNLLRLPSLLAHVCIPEALPSSALSLTNLWVGGHLMRNGLHFDQYDNLLFQLAGSKRALIYPPADAAHLYYGPSPMRRHVFSLPEGFAKESKEEKVRHNVARLNIFASDLLDTHPTVADASPTLCEIHPGDALFIPKGWHHAVISTAAERRNIAVNLWYDLQHGTAELRTLLHMFQQEGCSDVAASIGAGAGRDEAAEPEAVSVGVDARADRVQRMQLRESS